MAASAGGLKGIHCPHLGWFNVGIHSWNGGLGLWRARTPPSPPMLHWHSAFLLLPGEEGLSLPPLGSASPSAHFLDCCPEQCTSTMSLPASVPLHSVAQNHTECPSVPPEHKEWGGVPSLDKKHLNLVPSHSTEGD